MPDIGPTSSAIVTHRSPVHGSKTWALPSSPAVAILWPSGDQAASQIHDDGPPTLAIPSVRLTNSWTQRPRASSQTRATPSPPAVSKCCESGDQAIPQTTSPWPANTRLHSPVAASQIRAVRSPPAEAMQRPSGDHATRHTPLLWPVSTFEQAPRRLSHNLTEPSKLAVATLSPFGAQATPHTAPSWPISSFSQTPVCASQIRAV